MPFNLCDNAGIEGVALEYERKDNKKGNKAILGENNDPSHQGR